MGYGRRKGGPKPAPKRLFAGRTITLSVHPADRVRDLKDMVWGRTGVPPDEQRLVTSRRQLRGPSNRGPLAFS